MHGSYERSFWQRIVLTAGHLAAVLTVGWLLFFGGLERLAISPGNFDRRLLLFACSAIYFLRLLPGAFVFIKRSMEWSEVGTVLPWLWIIHLTFALTGGVSASPLGIVDIFGAGLYLAGSYLNTASEYQRLRWKRRVENRGTLYTEGLFRHAMHINYFGDSLLFTGFALITLCFLGFLIPLAMILSFVFMHIPALDRYLAERYGSQFQAYAKSTKKFIPFVY